MNVQQFKQSARKYIGKYSALFTITAVLATALALAAIFLQVRPAPPPAVVTDAYFFDLESGKIFISPITGIPPVAVPGAPQGSPPNGALAHLFSCGSCEHDSQRFIGYIELYARDIHDKLTASLETRMTMGMNAREAAEFTLSSHESDPDVQAGRLISAVKQDHPKDLLLFPYASPGGVRLRDEVGKRCGPDKLAIECQPPG